MNMKNDDFLIEEMKKENEKSNESKGKESILFDFDMLINIIRILIVLMICFALCIVLKNTLNALSEVYDDSNFETETVDTVTNENDYDARDFLTDYYTYRYFFGND